MKLPDPVAWRIKDDDASEHYGKDIHVYYDSADIRLDHPDAAKLTALLESLYSADQLRAEIKRREVVFLKVLDILEMYSLLKSPDDPATPVTDTIKTIQEILK